MYIQRHDKSCSHHTFIINMTEQRVGKTQFRIGLSEKEHVDILN